MNCIYLILKVKEKKMTKNKNQIVYTVYLYFTFLMLILSPCVKNFAHWFWFGWKPNDETCKQSMTAQWNCNWTGF